jgi:hypothetical protein
VQVIKSGPNLNTSSEHLVRLANEFKTNNYVFLKDLVTTDFLTRLSPRIDAASFSERTDEDIATEHVMDDEAATGMLLFAFNNQKLFGVIQQITGCEEIGCFIGRVYRFLPDSNHHDSWHDDRAGGKRLLGLSLNLGNRIHSGGVLEIRDKSSGTILSQITNSILGDAILFRLGDDLEHRVTDVTGKVARTVFAGWFQNRPHFRELFTVSSETPDNDV